jgi:prepilin-type N-terminal cleavage/methylation domain-containing protein
MRRGVTLAELLVALTLAAIVLGTATSSLLRQQRTAGSLGNSAAWEAQLRAATGAVAVELSALTAASGDLVAGEARDTALELRGFVTQGVACGDAAGAVVFADDPDEASSASEVRAGDSLWWNGGSAGDMEWHGSRVTSLDNVVLPCPLSGAAPRAVVRLRAATSDTIRIGAPLRVTRPVRYSLYRSGDGSWQLGLREWAEESRRLPPPQPIAGPFALRAGTHRSGFRYFAPDGTELSEGAGGVTVGRVARVRVTLLSAAASGAGAPGGRRDSIEVALQHGAQP